MTTGHNDILVVIPARGGSKRLPGKNSLPLAGKPLLCWTIEAALEAALDASILVTSDDDRILAIAREYEGEGVIAHKRPGELAGDMTPTADAVINAVIAERGRGNPSDTVILLQPTSPLRIGQDIVNALEMFRKQGARDTVVSVCEVDHPSAWVGQINDQSVFGGVELTDRRSQDYQKEYRLNGAVYVASVETVLGYGGILTPRLFASIMPRSRSFDIDDELDFRICESLLILDR